MREVDESIITVCDCNKEIKKPQKQLCDSLVKIVHNSFIIETTNLLPKQYYLIYTYSFDDDQVSSVCVDISF